MYVLEGVSVVGNFSADRMTKNGKTHFKMRSDYNVIVDTEKIDFHIYDLFKNNDELNNHINKVFHENIDVLKPDFLPVVGETMKTLFVQILNQVTDRFPAEELYPN